MIFLLHTMVTFYQQAGPLTRVVRIKQCKEQNKPLTDTFVSFRGLSVAAMQSLKGKRAIFQGQGKLNGCAEVRRTGKRAD